jgi:glycosyltransferase involved in cell wall biosynthesis
VPTVGGTRLDPRSRVVHFDSGSPFCVWVPDVSLINPPSSQSTTSSPLRVAHVGGYAPDSANGVDKTIVGLVDHLPQSQVVAEIWNFSPKHSAARWREEEKVRILQLPAANRPWSYVRRLPEDGRDALVEQSQNVDLVHFHSVFVPQNVWAAEAIEVPYVITPNGGYGPLVLRGRNRVAKSLWLQLHERRFITSATALHAVSPPETADLAELVPRERVFYVPNAIPETLLARDFGEPKEQALLFLGRLAILHKGLDLLVEGFARSAHARSSSVRLVIAGPDFRGGAKEIMQTAGAQGVEDVVELRGPVYGKAKWELFERCSVFVHTSRWEGLPFAVLEACAVGRPVLITPGTNMGDLVSRYRAGVVVEASEDGIAAGINELMSMSPLDRLEMGQRAKQMVRECFTWNQAARAMAHHYRKLVSAKET